MSNYTMYQYVYEYKNKGELRYYADFLEGSLWYTSYD